MTKILEYGSGFFNERFFSYSGKVLISLSGGRSSAAMLRMLLDQHGGALPDGFAVVFTNTDKEHEKTYIFLREIETRWGVPIIWLELTSIISDRLVEWKQVDFASCSRGGEPFRVLERFKPRFPPRRANRLCTYYMKVLVARQYVARALGWEVYTNLYGYRADESHRLQRMRDRCGKEKLPYFPDAPLLRAGISKGGVLSFWHQNDFDLGIPDSCGNCTFCFLKGEEKLRKVMRAMPNEIDWWIDLEKSWGKGTTSGKHPLQYTILPHGGYQGVKDRALATQAPPDLDDNIEDLECACTD